MNICGYWFISNSVKSFIYTEQPSERSNWMTRQGSNLKMISGMQEMSKSLSGQSCTYLMSCDAHDQIWDIYPKNTPAKFWKIWKKSRRQNRSHRSTDRWTNGGTGRQTDNTPSALGQGFKNHADHKQCMKMREGPIFGMALQNFHWW